MSSPDYRLVLSSDAEEDIVGILRYTAEQWGERQVEVYRGKLSGAFKALQANPSSGHVSDELADTHRLYRVGSHIIVYRVRGYIVEVVRILHKRMSLPLNV